MLLVTKVEVADVNGNLTGQVYTDIPDVSNYVWGKSDVSGSNAGRNQASDMIKSLKGKARTLDLMWSGRTYAEISKAFKAFDHEYLYLTYYDAITGKSERKHFYCGDFSATSFRSFDGGIMEMAKVPLIQSITDKV